MIRLARGEDWILVKCGKEYYYFARSDGEIPETGCINEQNENYNATEALKWVDRNVKNPTVVWKYSRFDSM